MPDRDYVLDEKIPVKADYGSVNNLPNLADMAAVSPREASAYLKSVCDFQRAHAKYLLKGRFVDDEGFSCASASILAKRFVAADGTSAVCVWNVTEVPVTVALAGLGEPTGVFAPGTESVTGPLAGDSIRLYVFGK